MPLIIFLEGLFVVGVILGLIWLARKAIFPNTRETELQRELKEAKQELETIKLERELYTLKNQALEERIKTLE